MAALALSAKEGANDGDEKLVDIIHFLRKALPTSALAPNETMTIPKGDHYEGYTEQNTVHVDEFLYTDEEAEELKDAGLLTHDYCADCGSRNLKPLSTFTFSFQTHQTLKMALFWAFSSYTSKRLHLDLVSNPPLENRLHFPFPPERGDEMAVCGCVA